jgi:hypothetical protein
VRGECSVDKRRVPGSNGAMLPGALKQKCVMNAVDYSLPTVAGVVLCALLSGCALTPMHKHAVAFSVATAEVISSSEDAYRAANDLRVKEEMEAAVYSYNYAADADLSFDPHKDYKPLFTPEQLAARITVLDCLKAYADSLVALTGKPSKEDEEALESASAGVGANLQGLSTTINTSFAGVPAITGTQSAMISTAMKALGEYLQNKTIKKELPKVTGEMNENVKALCELLEGDIAVIKTQADSDYTSLLMTENQFVLHNKLDSVEKRNEVEKLLRVVREQRANDRMLDGLNNAVVKLRLTHQALAAAAQGNNPGSLTTTIAELQAAGKDLSTFYKSLLASN